MKTIIFLFLLGITIVSCKDKTEKITPVVSSISESIYASGIIKSKNQYQVFSTVNGIIQDVFVSEGDSVKIGSPILTISNEAQKLGKENAYLNEAFLDINANQGKLNEAKLLVSLSQNKMKNDSMMFIRQKNLWQQQIGTKVELEQKELAFQNSKTSYYSSVVKYDDLKRQLNLSSQQAKNNFSISSKQENDFTIKSEINGIIYNLFKSKGENAGIQTPIAVVGDATQFVLEMQVDENDIFKLKKEMLVLITMDSYKGKVFEAMVTKIYPMMNERSKTFLIEATFVKQPEILYPNITFEANIILQSKNKALLIPREYLLNDSIVIKSNKEKVIVKTGLKDYQKIEILSGITVTDELIKPKL